MHWAISSRSIKQSYDVSFKSLWLQDHFNEVVPEKLRHDLRDLYKLRVGDYRIAYSVRGDIVTVEMVGHRSDVYKR